LSYTPMCCLAGTSNLNFINPAAAFTYLLQPYFIRKRVCYIKLYPCISFSEIQGLKGLTTRDLGEGTPVLRAGAIQGYSVKSFLTTYPKLHDDSVYTTAIRQSE